MEKLQENNLKYEILENINKNKILENINKNEINDIDNILNNENFFNDKEFHDQFQFFEQDNLMALHIDYFENYTVKMLQHIANYYKIPRSRLKKEELIQLIIQFENEPENSNKVCNRKRMWYYMNELKNDPYFSKFLIFFNS
jgi:hypothetical protein